MKVADLATTDVFTLRLDKPKLLGVITGHDLLYRTEHLPDGKDFSSTKDSIRNQDKSRTAR